MTDPMSASGPDLSLDAGEAGDEAVDDEAVDDDTIVLPWWQHPVNIVTMLVTVALLAGIAGWMIGDSNGRAHNDVDTGFLQDMREHHEQAVLMSTIYDRLPDTDPGLRIVVRHDRVRSGDRDRSHDPDLARLRRARGQRGRHVDGLDGHAHRARQMPGMATDDQLAQLQSSSGQAADALFAELMIAHHQGGVHMAEYARDHGKSGVVESFAESIIDSQQDEIGEIERELDS